MNASTDQLKAMAWEALANAEPEGFRNEGETGLLMVVEMFDDMAREGRWPPVRPGMVKLLGLIGFLGACTMMEEREQVKALEAP